MAIVTNTHVGDIGTTYVSETQNEDSIAFDPTSATTIEMIFKLPVSNIILTRPALVSTSGVGPKQKWFLNYTIVPADISSGLHSTPGIMSYQGHLIFPTGQEYHSNISTTTINPNLF